MESGFTRRNMLKALGGAALSGLSQARSEELRREMEFIPSSLIEKELDEQKTEAAEELVDTFWNHPRVRDHISKSFFGGVHDRHDLVSALRSESRMYIPSPAETIELNANNHELMRQLTHEVTVGKYGIFLHGDSQRMYVLHKTGPTQSQFVKAYPVSTSSHEWSNDNDSFGTPLGFHRITEVRKGMLGEVVSALNKNSGQFVRIPVTIHGKSTEKTFVRGLSSSSDHIPEVVTAAFLLWGEHTPISRGIRIHGTNRTDHLSYPASSGCIRVSNVDVYDLAKYVDAGQLVDHGTKTLGGTPVMIQATPGRRRAVKTNGPPRWIPPADRKSE